MTTRAVDTIISYTRGPSALMFEGLNMCTGETISLITLHQNTEMLLAHQWMNNKHYLKVKWDSTTITLKRFFIML